MSEPVITTTQCKDRSLPRDYGNFAAAARPRSIEPMQRLSSYMLLAYMLPNATVPGGRNR